MALTALEWLQLDKDERERRKGELSNHESFLLRTQYSYYDDCREGRDLAIKTVKGDKKIYTPEEQEAYVKSVFEMMKEIGVVSSDTDLETFRKNGKWAWDEA